MHFRWSILLSLRYSGSSHDFSIFQVFHEMVNGGVEANLHTYGALIDGCAKAGQVAKAFGAYGILRSKVICTSLFFHLSQDLQAYIIVIICLFISY